MQGKMMVRTLAEQKGDIENNNTTELEIMDLNARENENIAIKARNGTFLSHKVKV